jgi:hypothetical protein
MFRASTTPTMDGSCHLVKPKWDPLDDKVADTRATGEFTIVRPQDPKAKSESIPMFEICGEIGARHLRRAYTAQVAHDLRVKVQDDQIRKMIFMQPLGAQLCGFEAFHRVAHKPGEASTDPSGSCE